MTRYEFSDGKSHKFWSVERSGCDVTTEWGRIGTAGQSKTKSFADEEAAQKEVDKVTKSKTKKGYVLSSSSAASAPSKPKAPPKKSAPKASAPTPKPKAAAKKPADEGAELPDEGVVAVVNTESRAPSEPTELPDEDLPYLGAFKGEFPPTRAEPQPVPKMTPAGAWKKIVGRKAKPFAKVEMVDKAHMGTGTMMTEAMAGRPPDLGDDPIAAGAICAQIIHQPTRVWNRAGFVDLFVAKHGLAFATAATLTTYGFTGSSKGAAPGASLLCTSVHYIAECPPMVARLRAYATAATDEEYAQAVAAAGAMSGLGWSALAVRAYVFPDQPEYRAAAISALDGSEGQSHARAMLMEDPQSLDELAALGTALTRPRLYLSGSYNTASIRLAGAIAALGAEITPFLMSHVAPYLDEDWVEKDGLRMVAALFAATPSDAAYRWLAEHFEQVTVQGAMAEASSAFPVRVIRTLAPIAAGRSKRKDAAESILRSALRRYPESLEAALRTASPQLSERETKTLAALREEVASAPAVALSECPLVLREPRWLNPRKTTKKLKPLDLTPLQRAPTMKWPDGLQETWRDARNEDDYHWIQPSSEEQWDQQLGTRPHSALLVRAPANVARRHLARWKPWDEYWSTEWCHGLAARYELEVLPNLMRYLQERPADAMALVLPYGATEIAPIAADAYGRLKSARRAARDWLLLHPEAALIGLIPSVFGKAKKQQAAAQKAIALIVGEGHGDLLLKVAAEYGPEAEQRGLALRDFDPLDQLPKRMPVLPEWATTALPPELETGGTLPPEALHSFLLMLALSTPEERYPGVDMAAELLTAKSLAKFSWSLFEAWRFGGMDSKQSWAFHQLGHFGDDECARRLTPILRAWPGEGGHARATQGLDVLCAIGSDVALMNLYGISQKLKFKGLKNKAAEKVQEVARERGLTELELADRLVPDFDLDENGTLELDFGPRRFTLTFDESLKVVVRDADGKIRKSLPKVGAKDDAEKGAAATALFKSVKKDSKSVSAMQVARLEEAMCSGRSWAQEDFQQFFVDHPLMIHLVRRLVWASHTSDGTRTLFRVAEDRSITDGEDEEIPLPNGKISLAHRIQLDDEEAAAWSEVFADYELLQPFDQLGRATYRITDEENKSRSIERLKGQVVPTGKVIGLTKYGWLRGAPQDGGVSCWMERSTPEGSQFILELDPGMIAGMPDEWPEQTLGAVTLQPSGGWYSKSSQALSDASETLVSEVIRSLEMIRS